MDIDLRVLKLMETEKGIPFDELVEIIEQAILTAYQKHMVQNEPRVVPEKKPKSATGLGGGAGSASNEDQRAPRVAVELPEARVELDRKTGMVTIFVPEKDDEGVVIGEAIATPITTPSSSFSGTKMVTMPVLRSSSTRASGSSTATRGAR